jgi:1-phosphatidylinositol-4-phosphate 5-kinase
MKKSSNPTGGKSGEFFFFTYDNRLLLKTMTYSEFFNFKIRLEVIFFIIIEGIL